MLRIGNKAFTLVEVMVTTAVLSLGTVFIYESLFSSLDAFDYYINYLNVVSWADEKIWQAQDELSRLGPLAQIETSGSFVNRDRDFMWGLAYNTIDESPHICLYRIGLTLSWQQGHRRARLLRNAYAIYEEKESS